MSNNLPQRHFNHIDVEINCPELTDITTATGRIYQTPDGVTFPSITTLLKYVNKDSLDQWTRRVGEKESEKQKKKGASRGTPLHSLAENYINNVPNFDDGFAPAHKYLFKTLQPRLEHVDNIVAQEVPLYSKWLKLAGRVDLIAEYNGKPSIIDFKTAKKLKRTEWLKSYWMQATFYSIAFQELTGIKVPNLVLIFAHDDGTSAVFEEHRKNWINELILTNKQFNTMAVEKVKENLL